MAQRLSFNWDDDWADGELWRASSPGDFKDDEAVALWAGSVDAQRVRP